jgi:hypothetical protein
MAEYLIRGSRGLKDARPQYELWLRATKPLPRAWRSCLKNVEQQLRHAAQYPKSRLYAERSDGTLLGYIGTHPPFEWIATQHGPPARSLGWAIPFGFPWTAPLNEQLEVALYEEMIRVTPEIYAESPRDIYIQRFRESWSRELTFLEQRGWKLHDRVPLIGRKINASAPPPQDLIPLTRDGLALVADLCRQDDTAADKASAAELQERSDGGWIVHDTIWRLGERGTFALEQRGPWAAVTVFYAVPEAWNETLDAAAAQARQMGAREIYFTIDAHETRRRAALEQRGFSEVDAGVYYVRDAD